MQTFALIAIVAFGHAIATSIGFGSSVVVLALGAHFVPLERLVVVIFIIAWLQSAWVVGRSHGNIQWRLLGLRVLPFAVVGLVGGAAGRVSMSSDHLKLTLGLFVIAVAGIELARLLRSGGQSQFPRWIEMAIITIGGVFHGLLACGGPLVVLALSRTHLDKHQFRATLFALWFVLNSSLLIGAIVGGSVSAEVLALAGYVLPGLFVGVAVGELLHGRVSERVFRAAVQVVLVVTGVSLVV